jgi:hypothetical protein
MRVYDGTSFTLRAAQRSVFRTARTLEDGSRNAPSPPSALPRLKPRPFTATPMTS